MFFIQGQQQLTEIHFQLSWVLTGCRVSFSWLIPNGGKPELIQPSGKKKKNNKNSTFSSVTFDILTIHFQKKKNLDEI